MINTSTILQENIQLKEILSEKDKTIEAKNNYIKNLEEFIRSLKHKHFGASSEKVEAIQSDLFVEAEDESAEEPPTTEATVIVAEHSRKKHRISIPADLR